MIKKIILTGVGLFLLTTALLPVNARTGINAHTGPNTIAYVTTNQSYGNGSLGEALQKANMPNSDIDSIMFYVSRGDEIKLSPGDAPFILCPSFTTDTRVVHHNGSVYKTHPPKVLTINFINLYNNKLIQITSTEDYNNDLKSIFDISVCNKDIYILNMYMYNIKSQYLSQVLNISAENQNYGTSQNKVSFLYSNINNCNLEGRGSIIRINNFPNGKIIFDDCEILENKSKETTISCANSSLEVLNSKIFKNDSEKYGGAITAFPYSRINIDNGTIIYNNVTKNYGGGILAYPSSIIDLSDVKIYKNTADAEDDNAEDDNAGGGGGIYISHEAAFRRSSEKTVLKGNFPNNTDFVLGNFRLMEFFN